MPEERCEVSVKLRQLNLIDVGETGLISRGDTYYAPRANILLMAPTIFRNIIADLCKLPGAAM